MIFWESFMFSFWENIPVYMEDNVSKAYSLSFDYGHHT